MDCVIDEGVDLIIDDIEKLNPDICCFAEMVFEDEHGKSILIDKLSSRLGYSYLYSYVSEKCFYMPVEGKYYGQSIVSRYPLKNKKIAKLPNPELSYRQPDGEMWVTHDKFVQSVDVYVTPKKSFQLFNIHSFPFHLFGRSLTESAFDQWKGELESFFRLNVESQKIIVGDFNNKEVTIEELMPDAFKSGVLSSIISYTGMEHLITYDRSKIVEAQGLVHPEQKYAKDTNQVDYMLVTSEIKSKKSYSIIGRSDHPALFAVLEV